MADRYKFSPGQKKRTGHSSGRRQSSTGRQGQEPLQPGELMPERRDVHQPRMKEPVPRKYSGPPFFSILLFSFVCDLEDPGKGTLTWRVVLYSPWRRPRGRLSRHRQTKTVHDNTKGPREMLYLKDHGLS